MFEQKLSRANLSDEIYELLAREIAKGSFPPASKLLEDRIAGSLGVSKGPVREAMVRLVGDGVIELRPRRGFYARPASPTDVRDIVDLRMALESLSLARAAENPDRAWVSQLGEIQARFADCLARGDEDGCLWNDICFHEAIYTASRNSRLSHMGKSITLQAGALRVLDRKSSPTVLQVSQEQHARIYEAVVAMDLKRAQHVLRNHLEQHRDRILGVLSRSAESSSSAQQAGGSGGGPKPEESRRGRDREALGRRLRRRTLSDEVYGVLSNRISVGLLPPGSKLRDTEIARDLDVSKVPVREAFFRLIGDGVVELRPGYGFFMRGLTWADVNEIVDVRIVLETIAVTGAASRLRAGTRRTLTGLLKAGQKCLDKGDIPGFLSSDNRFHGSISLASGNARLSRMLASLVLQIGILHAVDARSSDDVLRECHDQHARVYEALAAENASAAAGLLRRHLEDHRARVLTALADTPESQPVSLSG